MSQKCLPSWPNHCEMLVASVKAASEVAVLALYSESQNFTKHVRVQDRPPLSEAVIGDEKKVISFSCKLWSVSVVKSSCSVLWFQHGLLVWYLSQAMSVLAELIVYSMRGLYAS